MEYSTVLQNEKCNVYGLIIKEDDIIEFDHILPKKLGGTDKTDHEQLLHTHCHGASIARGSDSESTNLDDLNRSRLR